MTIIPVLVATRGLVRDIQLRPAVDGVFEPILANANTLLEALGAIAKLGDNSQFDAELWSASPYKPTPTIIEAAQALYSHHSVAEISRSDAGAINLSRTTVRIFAIVDDAKARNKKTLCLMTGVPGSGKTLAGLNIAIQRTDAHSEDHAVYLSGNGPLVAVLREALAQNQVVLSKEPGGSPVKKSDAKRRASAFIQNIHHFRDECLKSEMAPVEKVVIFDEAQRAWNKAQASSFMRQKRGVDDFDQSEPDFLLSAMDRHADWCVVVCLVGGGQEINTGEAGVIEWLQTIQRKFPYWNVYCSDLIDSPEYSWGVDVKAILNKIHAHSEPDLHLSVSLRSYRAEHLAAFVSAVISGDSVEAAKRLKEIPNYPIAVTRKLDTAREWLREKARGSERYGLVASSNALRLKPHGVHVKSDIDPIMWFLKGKNDVRSACSLEDVATEFAIQGLELDWVCLCWDANFRWNGDAWGTHEFVGTKWHNVHDENQQRYIANAYRVLMTRARQGLVIFVPPGDERDDTRVPSFYDGTYELLLESGVPVL